MSIGVERIPNKRGRAAILMRRSWREGKRIRKKTLANLTDLSEREIAGIDAVLGGGVAFRAPGEAVTIRRSLPHGHVAAVPGTARGLRLERILHRRRSRMRDPALAAIVSPILSASSKLATARQLSPESATSSLGTLPGPGPVTGGEMPEMPDWQSRIEGSLARRHLTGGTLILHDVGSSCLEGSCCPLAAFVGHSRDGKRGRKQITHGLLCARDGCPVAVAVFAGNTADPQTVASQVKKIRARFGIGKVALTGDRGMITTARIREDLEPAGPDRISALGSSDIGKPVRGTPSVPVPGALAEIVGPDFPGERLMVCLDPGPGQERARKREELPAATEEVLSAIAAAHGRGRKGSAEGGEAFRHPGYR